MVVLGLTLGHWKLNEMLPPRLTDKLVMRTFPLARGLERMDAFFETALLSDDCGLCLGHAMLCDLDHTFLAHDFTFRSFINALKVRCLYCVPRLEALTKLKGVTDEFDARKRLVKQIQANLQACRGFNKGHFAA